MKLIVNQVSGDVRTVAVEGDGWSRVIVIVPKDNTVSVDFLNGDKSKLLITRKDGEDKNE